MLKLQLFAVILGTILICSTAMSSTAFADEQNTSVGKQRPQADEIKQKAQTLIKGKMQEDRVLKMKLEQQKATSKYMRENAKQYNEKEASDLQKSFLKQAQQKRDSDELHRKIIQDKIEQKSKMIQLKIKKMVESGQLGMHEKKTVEYGRTK